MDVKTAGSLGGKARSDKYTQEDFKRWGGMASSKLKEKYGEDYFKKIRRGEKPSQG